MATGKSNCEIVNCHRAASACCFCCKNNVCTSHFVEHIERVKARIDPLANEANNVMEKVQRLSVDQLSRPVYTELNQWRKEMHEFIDDIHQSSMKEIEEMLNKNKQKFNEHQEKQSQAMMKLQDDVKQLAEDGDVTLERIESFENQLQAVGTSLDVFEKSFLSIKTQPLKGKLVFISSNLQQATNNVDKTQATPVYNPGANPVSYAQTQPPQPHIFTAVYENQYAHLAQHTFMPAGNPGMNIYGNGSYPYR